MSYPTSQHSILTIVHTIENYHTTIDNLIHEMKYDKSPQTAACNNSSITSHRKTVQNKINDINSILDKTTAADIDGLIALIPIMEGSMYERVDHEDTIAKKTILDAIITTISKYQGSPYVMDPKLKRKNELLRQLAAIESELPYLEHAKYSSYSAPELVIRYERYIYAKSKISEELKTL
jgi:hypothetical protein